MPVRAGISSKESDLYRQGSRENDPLFNTANDVPLEYTMTLEGAELQRRLAAGDATHLRLEEKRGSLQESHMTGGVKPELEK